MSSPDHKCIKQDKNTNPTDPACKPQQEDFISELPDPILHHILSYLLTKEAVLTTILSKRWPRLWTSIPILDFTEWKSSFSDNSALFMNFVERLLLKRDNSVIEKFRLVCDDDCDSSRVYSWLYHIIKHGIQELDLFFENAHDNFIFPRAFFTCESLTDFKLAMSSDFRLPDVIHFPCLKILYLKYVAFTDEDVFDKLFGGCPVLEELYLDECKWLEMEVINISAPLLKKFSLTASGFYAVVWGFENCEILINTPNLTEVTIKGYLPKYLSVCYLPSLATASIDVQIDDLDLDFANESADEVAMMCLTPFANTQALILSRDMSEVLFRKESLLTRLPAFNNLLHLEVRRGLYRVTNTMLLYLLQISPNLESLVLSEALQYKYNIEDCSRVSVVPECLLLHLKNVEIREFHGWKAEIDMIEFLLTNARVLERMLITCFINFLRDLDKKTEVMERILKFSKCSAKCVIKFRDY